MDDRSDSYLSKIDTSASRMLMLIRDVLAFSQLSQMRDEFVKISLNDILDCVKSDFELLIDETAAVIESKSLPVIEGIPIQITQLFSNLISNSLKFAGKVKRPEINIDFIEMTEGEVRRHKMLNPTGTYYKISFRDNGIGFSQENAAQIFHIFQRLHARNEYQGTGIGLAICKKIAQTHNGEIYAESTPGEGATFHVILPKPLTDQTRA